MIEIADNWDKHNDMGVDNFEHNTVEKLISVSIIIDKTVFIFAASQYVSIKIKFSFEQDETLHSFELILFLI